MQDMNPGPSNLLLVYLISLTTQQLRFRHKDEYFLQLITKFTCVLILINNSQHIGKCHSLRPVSHGSNPIVGKAFFHSCQDPV